MRLVSAGPEPEAAEVSVVTGVASSHKTPFSAAIELATSESLTFSSPFSYINLTRRDSISSSAEIARLGRLTCLTRSDEDGFRRLGFAPYIPDCVSP